MPVLENGSQVGIVGGGPAGAFFACSFLDTARWMGLAVEVEIFEPRDLARAGPSGCNMCGGVVSESLLQTLAAEGLLLPSEVRRQGIDSYVLHTNVGRAVIDRPLQEKRIVALYRGGGPGGPGVEGTPGLDAFLLSLARQRGAMVVRDRVEALGWLDGKPLVRTKGGVSHNYDLLVGAVGVNSGAVHLFEDMGFGYRAPRVARGYACEFSPGKRQVRERLGSSFHVFLLDVPGVDFAALIPKGEHITLCILGEGVSDDAVRRFLAHPEVVGCTTGAPEPLSASCRCSPKLNVGASRQPFGDRVVIIGDSGTTRLFKDGLGAAYRTAKAAAATALLEGVSAEAFRSGYWPTCQAIDADNAFGRVIFAFARRAGRRPWAHRAMLRIVEGEGRREATRRVLSSALWDVFTGSAPYRELLVRSARPDRLGRMLWTLVAAGA